MGAAVQYLRFNLINKHGVSDQRGEVLIAPSEIESARSFIHTDHILSHHEIGAIITTKTGDKHYVSQHTNEIAEMLRMADDRERGWIS
ncbi:hypothetical protein [[Mycobacterium] vasticus]|uniref:Uncharacterized protein n=1 Tax=[Mycobacterium] vasticus TaxID=2875777 RepID=A0ABU5YZP5_9MYCO|nr:hypothetical protein [Mycolicibacter sp. MYC017]MEB3070612.1 hypothetical protein [Mycolicibacter sp. MYC017]